MMKTNMLKQIFLGGNWAKWELTKPQVAWSSASLLVWIEWNPTLKSTMKNVVMYSQPAVMTSMCKTPLV